jgi:hypothetical protein
MDETLKLTPRCVVRCTGEPEQRSAGEPRVPAAPWRFVARGESPPGMDVLRRRFATAPLQDDSTTIQINGGCQKKLLLLLVAIGIIGVVRLEVGGSGGVALRASVRCSFVRG